MVEQVVPRRNQRALLLDLRPQAPHIHGQGPCQKLPRERLSLLLPCSSSNEGTSGKQPAQSTSPGGKSPVCGAAHHLPSPNPRSCFRGRRCTCGPHRGHHLPATFPAEAGSPVAPLTQVCQGGTHCCLFPIPPPSKLGEATSEPPSKPKSSIASLLSMATKTAFGRGSELHMGFSPPP